LPLLPEFVAQLNTFYFFLGGMSLLSGVVVWYFGPRELLLKQSAGVLLAFLVGVLLLSGIDVPSVLPPELRPLGG
jgi:hypothetical protein